MRWESHLKEAVEGGKPIVLNLEFDPGWRILRSQFERKAAIDHRPSYVTRCLKAASHRFGFSNTSEFLKIAEGIHQIDPAALDRTYVYFENDIRRFRDFVIGRRSEAVLGLQKSFHTAQRSISKLSNADRGQFVEDMKKREKRASVFPRLFLFRPSEKTQKLEDASGALLRSFAEREGTGNPETSSFVVIQAIKATNQEIRKQLRDRPQTAIIASPYVHFEEFQQRFDETQEAESDDKCGLIHMRVDSKRQISGYIPYDIL